MFQTTNQLEFWGCILVLFYVFCWIFVDVWWRSDMNEQVIKESFAHRDLITEQGRMLEQIQNLKFGWLASKFQ